MPKVLTLAEAGQQILRQEAARVQNIDDPIVQELIDDMHETCEANKGMGISAPQVFYPLQVMIVASKPNERYPHAPLMQPVAMINPTLNSAWGGNERGWEGCLSIPEIYGLVDRPQKISITYTDRRGKKHDKELEGFVARVFMHELDHLKGVLFIDHVHPHNIVTKGEYLRIIKK